MLREANQSPLRVRVVITNEILRRGFLIFEETPNQRFNRSQWLSRRFWASKNHPTFVRWLSYFVKYGILYSPVRQQVAPPNGGDTVVTYSDLFQFGLLIVGIIGLCFVHKKK